ncbi:MAG: L,D-transpeptidase family protein [Gammaproteobacteria bacterium]|nr:L,D-transpeptidase family protein [Gammaproteobacteria bacterium]
MPSLISMPIALPATLLAALLLSAPAPVAAVYDPLGDLDRSLRGGGGLEQSIRQQFQGRRQGGLLAAADWAALAKFYQERDYKSLWIERNRPSALVAEVLQLIRETPLHGVDSALLVEFRDFQPSTPERTRLASYEVQFSEVLLAYARAMAAGRFPPKQYDADWLIKPRPFSVQGFLGQMLKGEKSLLQLLKELPPQHAAYQRLLKVYGYYRTIAERGGWSPLPAQMESLKPGQNSRWTPALRQRLRAEFSFHSLEPDDSSRYEPDLVAAVKAFQWRNGLGADGVVGPATRAALNVTVEERLRDLVASIERWRWLPRNLDDRFIMVNIPAFELTLYQADREFWKTRVIVGSKQRPSPSIESRISQLKVNPDWHVPESITLKDLLPKQLSNPRYLTQAGYQVFLRDRSQEIDPSEIDWAYYQTAALAASSSRCPAPTPSFSTTPRARPYSTATSAPSAPAASACRSPTSWQAYCLRRLSHKRGDDR